MFVCLCVSGSCSSEHSRMTQLHAHHSFPLFLKFESWLLIKKKEQSDIIKTGKDTGLFEMSEDLSLKIRHNS